MARLRPLCLLVLWLGLALPLAGRAQSDVWGWVDDQGTAHFATERIDPHYQLFFRAGESYDSRFLPARPDAAPAPHAARASAQSLQTLIAISPGMKAVARQMRETARAAGVDFELLQAVIAAESGFDAAAVSPRGAVGLMQLMPATAQQYGVVLDARKPLNPQLADTAVNLRAGSRHLRYLIDRFPDRLDLAVAAYNAGEGAVQRAGRAIPPYPETRDYVQTVMQLYRSLKPGGNPRAAPIRVRMEIPAQPDTVAESAVQDLPPNTPGIR
ncbi:transglycosylase SLT domain-containing protein [Xylophilus rhododendri]|uniref:Transglycosylase SLT domain-containing protein n=1 Tax=Xylophilus rhododendri TaxID=2697032 RepID=A0A857J325_9BURK|nr:lytic transglycosylase domain-containing protein [Xylophilus rhododendri]QHI97288.1 transglycosylase SLT domain-containing protein [Xylophilus rhododendri]